jgi:acetyl-CoA carboxylase biotin carboxyl carrier protein
LLVEETNTMNLKEIRELIEFLKEQDIAEFELERGDVKVRIKRGAEAASTHETRYVTMPAVIAPVQPGVPAVTPAGESAKPAEKAPEPAPEENLHLVKSPIVGTFYESPSPGAPPFVKPGDQVALGQVLCIVEAMKLMNEIESDVAGELVKMLVTNNQPIEYGQPLYAIRPNA